MVPELSSWQWVLLTLGAFVTGLSKGGIAGLGILAVACFANALPARESTGALLPLLIAADVIGVTIYRKHADWPKLWRLFPWVAGGVVLGCFALGRVSNAQVGRLIGGILLAMVALHLWRQRPLACDANGFGAQLPHTWWFAGVIGAWAGFTTMVANAAGPVMVMFLLAAGLPKLEFLGTMAWFFLVVNCFKVPFSAWLGLINVGSLKLDAWLLIAMVPGALLGPVIVKRINQQTFEQIVLVLTIAAAVRLLM
jgi:uncharacterized membrane protein YfcA